MFMNKLELIKILKGLGLSNSENIGEFWYENKHELHKSFSQMDSQILDVQMRWETDMGASCQRQIRQFIEGGLIEFPDSPVDDWGFRIIDFENFKFVHNEEIYTLKDFENKYQMNRGSSYTDLYGINLEGLEISDCRLRNIIFMFSNLSGAKFTQVKLDNTQICHSYMPKSCLMRVWLLDGSSLSRTNVDNSYIHSIVLQNNTFGLDVIYNKVNYWQLLFSLFKTIFHKNYDLHSPFGEHSHTKFSMVNTTNLNGTGNHDTNSYLAWYQYIFKELDSFKNSKLTDKVGFSLSLIFTKSWRSYMVLAVWGFLINIIFATIYWLNSYSFINLDSNFLSAFYYSIVTFTTLGYGEITPITNVARLLVITEVCIGFVMFGCLVFLIGNKVNDRY